MKATDQDLLREFACCRSQDAFTELVRRHVQLVYSAALRQVRSPELAEEVAQSVFTDLALQAGKMQPATILGAWLYRVTRRTTIDVVRRQTRERLAMEIAAMNAASDSPEIEPLLDEAMDALDESDRTAILLRYFEDRSLREVGAMLGTSEDAAQKRVSRAVERLREVFAKRGLALGSGTLVAALSATAAQAAPAGLAASIAAGIFQGAVVPTSAALAATKIIAMTTLQKSVIILTLSGLAGTGLYQAHQASRLRSEIQSFQHRSESALRAQNELLRQELARFTSEYESPSNRLDRIRRAPQPRLPAPPMGVATAVVGTDDLPETNVLLHLIHGGEAPWLTAAQIERYLQENRRSAGSLLAAYRTSKDTALLREAMEKNPAEPQVAFEAVFSQANSPAERREWLENFKKAAPDNPVASYLSALDYFKSGQTDQAVQELVAASGKHAFADYTMERIQADEEAFRSADYSEAETKMAATWGVALPQLAEFKTLAQNMVDLANAYRKGGDEASFQAALQMTVALGRQLDGPQAAGVPLISRMVGMAVEQMALNSLDPAGAFGPETVQARLDQLTQRRATIKELVRQTVPIQEQMTPQDWINYNNRTLAFGEENAIQWLLNKYVQK